MGRLIDTDKVIKDMQYYHDDCAQTSEYTRLGFETAIEVVKSATPVEAIPKADYEARLKADMVAMLKEIQLEIEELDSRAGYGGNGMPTFSNDYIRKKKVNELIQQKIAEIQTH